jgi:hypothetical protein
VAHWRQEMTDSEDDFKPSRTRPAKRVAPDAPATGVADGAEHVMGVVPYVPCRAHAHPVEH